MVTQFRHKRLMGKLFILHGDHGDSHFVGILVDDIAEIAKTVALQKNKKQIENRTEK